MYRLTTLKHGDEFLDLSLSRLGLFDGADPVQNGVPVSAVQRFKEGSGRRICVQRALKIAGHLGAAGGCIGSIPSPIRNSSFDLRETGRLHSSFFL
jgi:hypothetical protein